jgi:hypothetical protein
MADNRNKDQNQNKQQPPMGKPDRSVERHDGNRQQSGNRGGGNKDIGNENREIQSDVETDNDDEITQRNPRLGEDVDRK